MQSVSVDMVRSCLLSFRLLSISLYFLALIITLYFAHVYICFSAYLNSSPGSSLWSGQYMFPMAQVRSPLDPIFWWMFFFNGNFCSYPLQ